MDTSFSTNLVTVAVATTSYIYTLYKSSYITHPDVLGSGSWKELNFSLITF
jgi:hypothetical protein